MNYQMVLLRIGFMSFLLLFTSKAHTQNTDSTSKSKRIKPDSVSIPITPHDTIIVRNHKPDAVKIGYEVVDGDTIPVYLYNDVYLQSLQSPEEIKRYKKLVRDVKVALPYAKLAAFRLQMMEDNLSMIKSKRARKKYISECEKAVKEEFMSDLKNLTVTQGKILLKLIHRETGKTTWEILKTYSGTLEPLFWNTMANLYGASTKETFDPVVDREIEEIIKKLELE
ncbi:MAG: DUF4294 domain-containing protein [Bacteroidetes bacterium]|nr:DUF4294 domain-containing protein [Bacteroidota bacterium]